MYEEIFQTTHRPFRATPDIRFYFPFESMEQTRQTVLRAVRRAEGPVAVMGGVGLGKSLLSAMLAEDLSDRFDVVRLHATRLCSRRAMLQNILFELQLPYRDLSEGELRLSLMERMEPSPAHAAEGLALIVDEAQTLPTKLLEELRLITNFARQGQSRARLVLLGSLQLEETLALPEMSSFNQRLAARCFLQPMNRVQTADFVRHQFTCAQVDPRQMITRDALENVYIASEGIPRLVNQVMDHALILAIAGDQYPISASLIQEAWADLQQLPMTWNQTEAPEGTPVEFGSIDDMDQDFELEPEGFDELEAPLTSQLDWPAPSDLEDFGPVRSEHTAAAPQPTSKTMPRVVFDASTVFGQKANVPTTKSPAAAKVTIKPQARSADSGVVRPLTIHDQPVNDQDMFIFPDEPQANDSPQPDATSVRNMFAAWNPPAETYTYEFDLPRTDSGEPTEYRLAQSELAQSEEGPYETSDYQLAAWPDEMNLGAQPVPMPLTSQSNSHAADPFGEDFDEEFTVEATDVRRWQARQQERRSRDSQRPLPTASSQPQGGAQPASDAYDLGTSQPLVVQPNFTDEAQFMTLTASSTVDEQVVAEIEDLISQLNFSAFSVEMDSVEKISPECIRQAAAAAQYCGDDSDQQYEQANVLQMRRPHSEVSTPSMDDDRDLLIIEEEVPSSMRHAAPVPQVPTSHTMSYPDLFQQLRG